MNLAPIIAHAARTAQGILAPLGDPDGEGEFTVTGDASAYTYVGVFNEFDATDPLDPTGIKQIRLLTIRALKAQKNSAHETALALCLKAAPRRTLTAKTKSWTIQSVSDQPNFYGVTCRLA